MVSPNFLIMGSDSWPNQLIPKLTLFSWPSSSFFMVSFNCSSFNPTDNSWPIRTVPPNFLINSAGVSFGATTRKILSVGVILIFFKLKTAAISAADNIGSRPSTNHQ